MAAFGRSETPGVRDLDHRRQSTECARMRERCASAKEELRRLRSMLWLLLPRLSTLPSQRDCRSRPLTLHRLPHKLPLFLLWLLETRMLASRHPCKVLTRRIWLWPSGLPLQMLMVLAQVCRLRFSGFISSRGSRRGRLTVGITMSRVARQESLRREVSGMRSKPDAA